MYHQYQSNKSSNAEMNEEDKVSSESSQEEVQDRTMVVDEEVKERMQASLKPLV
jgi:hypothetical protein